MYLCIPIADLIFVSLTSFYPALTILLTKHGRSTPAHDGIGISGPERAGYYSIGFQPDGLRGLHPLPLHLFRQLCGYRPATAMFRMLQVPFCPLLKIGVLRHPVRFMPFLVYFHIMIMLVQYIDSANSKILANSDSDNLILL